MARRPVDESAKGFLRMLLYPVIFCPEPTEDDVERATGVVFQNGRSEPTAAAYPAALRQALASDEDLTSLDLPFAKHSEQTLRRFFEAALQRLEAV